MKINPRKFGFVVVIALLACLGSTAPAPAQPRRPTGQDNPAHARGIEHVIVLSIDGLMPVAYIDPDRHGLEVPTLRHLAARGAYSRGARSVMPTVTYPAHTTIATGTYPDRHRITTNKAWDPLHKNHDGWRWYAQDIAAATLWDKAHERGLRTALINWPVTVGARADALVPEYWRAGTSEDAKLLRALSTPGLLQAVERRFPDLWDKLTPPNVADEASIDIAVHLLESNPPALMLIHIWMVDEQQHQHGLWSEPARAAIETADRQVARLLDEVSKAGIAPTTALVLVSDHGFASARHRMRPGVLLRELGLVTLDDTGQVVAWRATMQLAGGTALFYLGDERDEQAKSALTQMAHELVARPGSGVGRMYTRQQLRALRADPAAFIGLEAADDFAFTTGYDGERLPARTGAVATHGFDPDRPEMQAALLLYGAPIRSGELTGARLIDVAPTVARWLDIDLPDAEGTPLQ
jgi:predicted AlkP superfamily pyrophosphatase or phosphodiesterase